MSVAARVFRGYGNGTVIGSVGERVHRGYSVGAEVVATTITGRVSIVSKTPKHTVISVTPRYTVE